MRSRTLLALLLCTPPAYGADAALQAVFQRMDKAAGSFKGFTANLVKRDHYAIMDNTDTLTGTIAVSKPSPHSIQVLEKFTPDGEQIELNNTRVQIYHPKTNTLQGPDDVGKRYHGLVDEVLLIGLGGTSADMKDEYKVTFGGPETVGGQAATRLVLIPNDPQLSQSFPKVEVWISDASGIAVQQKLYEKGLADYHVQTYTDMKIGPVTEAQVRLVVPKDAHREHLIH
jgi:outer membrane lipoprotein-sorting protein